jgi:hypothetical protein
MKFLKSVFLLIGLGMIAALVACSSSKTTTTPPPPAQITVSLSSVPSTLYVSSTTPITATVTNDSSNAGVSWSCAPAGSCGTFSSNNKTASGTAVTYTAPTSVPSGTVTITATSVAETSASASTSAITISTSSITVALSGTPASLPTGGTASLTATVANDSANGGVNWSCAPAGSCGSFSPANPVASGTAVTYTAPSTAGTVTVTATSVTDNAINANAQFAVTSSVASTLPDGNYVFSVSGIDLSSSQSSQSPYVYIGAFTVASGAITAGEQDFTDVNNPSGFVRAEPITSGTITATSDGNLAITLNFTDAYIANGNGQVTLDASLVSSSEALLLENDGWASGHGELDLQSTVAPPSGGYAFYENGGGGLQYSIGGVVNVDGSGTISGAGSVFDINDFGTTYSDQPVTSGTVTTPDSFGNVTFALDSTCSPLCTNIPTNGASIVLDGYMIDANRIRIAENFNTDSISFNATGGTMLTQTGTGAFSASSVSGSSYVFAATGGDPNGALNVAGVITFNSDGTVGGDLSYNDSTQMNSQGGETITGGTYSVDPTGRVTVMNATDATADFNTDLQFYLNGATPGKATLISMDGSDQIAGVAWQQTGSTLTAASLTGSYAMVVSAFIPSIPAGEQDGVGAFNSDGSANLTGFLDFNGLFTTGTQVADVGFSGTYATSSTNGVFSTNLTLQGATSASPFTTYLVDGTQGVTLENDATQTIGYFAQQ